MLWYYHSKFVQFRVTHHAWCVTSVTAITRSQSTEFECSTSSLPLTHFPPLRNLRVTHPKKSKLINIFSSDSRIWLSFQLLFGTLAVVDYWNLSKKKKNLAADPMKSWPFGKKTLDSVVMFGIQPFDSAGMSFVSNHHHDTYPHFESSNSLDEQSLITIYVSW